MGNPPLIVGLLINGVAYAAIFIIVALVIYRFAGEFAWRAFLVLFLFIAAGLYIVFVLTCLLTMGNFATGFMSAAKLLLSPSSSVQAAFFSAG